MPAWEAYRRARLQAHAHVQIALDPEETFPATLHVVGTVIRIFADRNRALRIGDRIGFDQPFLSRQDLSDMADPVLWGRARFAEAYLNRHAGTWQVTCDQFTLLRVARERPVNPAAANDLGIVEGPGLRLPTQE